MLLAVAIALLGIVAMAGIGLGGLYMLVDRPPAGLRWPGILHGAGGVAGFGVLLAGLVRTPTTPHAVRMGAGGFSVVAAALLAGALVAGGLILLTHLRGRPVSLALVASHGLLAITGYTLLVTYLTMLY
jgi:hypothetical protein